MKQIINKMLIEKKCILKYKLWYVMADVSSHPPPPPIFLCVTECFLSYWTLTLTLTDQPSNQFRFLILLKKICIKIKY